LHPAVSQAAKRVYETAWGGGRTIASTCVGAWGSGVWWGVRMARNDQAEVESLKREVDYLRSEHVKRGHEHRQEMKEKEDSLAKRLKRAEKSRAAWVHFETRP